MRLLYHHINLLSEPIGDFAIQDNIPKTGMGCVRPHLSSNWILCIVQPHLSAAVPTDSIKK